MQPSGQSLATQRLVINPENPCYRQQEVLFHLPPDRLDSQRLSEDGYARWWLRSRAENEDDDAHDGRRLKSLEVNMSGGFGKCSAGDGSFITRICSIALFAMVNSSQTGVFLSKSPAGTRERSGQPANREVHRIRFVQIRVPAAGQIQKGVYVALGEFMASPRPHIGDEATGVFSAVSKPGVDLLDPSSQADVTRAGNQRDPLGD